MFDKLKIQLELQEWPSVYMFKFIVLNEPQKIAQVSSLFSDEADIRLQPSKNDKYMSLTGTELMLSAGHVIERYEMAAKFEGVIAL
ncbi:MAG: DUF493 family protein [Bacteroidetes bacterium]|nr:MAG: DUF493 family protein [Bacteroidota bacterium]